MDDRERRRSTMSDGAIPKPYVMQSKCHLWRADDDGDGGVQRNGRGYMSRMHAHVQSA